MKKFLILLAFTGLLLGCGNKDNGGKKPANPQGNLYKEPIVTFGASKSTIKNTETLPLQYENDAGLLYTGPDYQMIYLFEFDKLTNSGVILPLITDSKDIISFLSSRYEDKGQHGEKFYWESKNGEMTIVVDIDPQGIIILYMPKSDMLTSSKSLEPNEVFDFIKEYSIK